MSYSVVKVLDVRFDWVDGMIDPQIIFGGSPWQGVVFFDEVAYTYEAKGTLVEQGFWIPVMARSGGERWSQLLGVYSLRTTSLLYLWQRSPASLGTDVFAG